MIRSLSISMAAVSILLVSCAHRSESGTANTSASAAVPQTGGYGTASMKPAANEKVSGTVTFMPAEGGTRVMAKIDGLTPNSTHGFHIHEVGDCSHPQFQTAQGHFNPSKKNHGAPETSESHAGDLGNLVSDANGTAIYDKVIPHLKEVGSGVVGRAVIVHQKADDLKTQPTGDSGGRIACGVITATQL